MTGGSFQPGDRVLVTQRDPAGHTRAPRYVRGRVGTIVAWHGVHPLPDSVVAGDDPPDRQPVYAVSFTAQELFGAGYHTVVVNLWESYLREADSS
jgi:hypothetical protein